MSQVPANTAQYSITGMSCGHCEAAIRSEIASIPGVTVVDVSAATGTLIVASDAAIDDAAVRAAVDEAGFEVA